MLPNRVKHVMDLREPPKDLPPLDFNLTQSDRILAEKAAVVIELDIREQNKRDQRKKG